MSSFNMQMLDISKIRTNGKTQQRTELDVEYVKELVEAYRRGDQIPPVRVYFDGREYWLADGFHRLAACKRRTRVDTIQAIVIDGTLQDAVWESLAVNNRHGKQLSKPERVNVVKLALKHTNGKSASPGDIAKHLNISERTVMRYMSELQEQGKLMRKPKPSEIAKQALSDPANRGKSNRRIAKEAGVSLDSVNRAAGERKGTVSEIVHDQPKPDDAMQAEVNMCSVDDKPVVDVPPCPPLVSAINKSLKIYGTEVVAARLRLEIERIESGKS